jgi:putative PIN family toxin of toxin-antitoxin system
MRSRKIVLDTNLWLSFLISKRLNAIDDLIDSGNITLVFSKESIEEFITVAKRPKFKKYFTASDLQDLIRRFDKYGKLVKVSVSVTECRDKKDNFLLNLAIESKADYLVTGDDDLLVLKKIKKTIICTWSEFLKEIKH